MKTTDIEEGATYVGKGGTEQRTVLKMSPGAGGVYPLRPVVVVTYRTADDPTPVECQLVSFSQWARCRLP